MVGVVRSSTSKYYICTVVRQRAPLDKLKDLIEHHVHANPPASSMFILGLQN